MELKILEEKQNNLFNRKEIKAEIDSESTPSRDSVLTLLSEKTKVPKENIKIKYIHGNFGIKKFNLEANLYSSPEEKEAVELKKKKESAAETKPEPAAAPEEKPAEAAPEQPAPEPQPEAKEEKSEEKTEEVKE